MSGPLRGVARLGAAARPRFATAAATGAGAAAATVGLAATAAWLIARAAQHPPVLYLMVAIVAVRAFGLSRGVLRYAERLLGHDAALRVLAALRVRSYRRLATLAPTGLAGTSRADLTARLVGDIDGLADLWLRLALPYAAAGLVGAATVTLTALLLPASGLTLAASLLLVALAAPAAAARVSRRAEARIAPLRGDLATSTAALLDGAAELTAHGALARALADIDAADERLSRAERRAAAGQGVAAAVSVAAGGAAAWAAVALSGPAVTGGTLTTLLAAVVILTPLAVHEIFAALPPAAAQLPRLLGAARRVTAVLEHTDPVTEPDRPAPRPAAPYDVVLSGVSTRWAPGEPDVLRGANLTLPAGSRTVITGASGSGKSTLAALLLRFLEPTAGTLTVAGTDLRALTGEDARTLIGLCAQDVHLFDTTIAANLRLARPDATDADLHAALAAARLDEFVATLPAGIDTTVGEHGNRLSGGQRQRLALARALLADFPVLILDEPTEHLAEDTAAALTHDLLAATAGRTVLLLTHRTTGLADADAHWHLADGTLHRVGVSAATRRPPARTFVS